MGALFKIEKGVGKVLHTWRVSTDNLQFSSVLGKSIHVKMKWTLSKNDVFFSIKPNANLKVLCVAKD